MSICPTNCPIVAAWHASNCSPLSLPPTSSLHPPFLPPSFPLSPSLPPSTFPLPFMYSRGRHSPPPEQYPCPSWHHSRTLPKYCPARCPHDSSIHPPGFHALLQPSCFRRLLPLHWTLIWQRAVYPWLFRYFLLSPWQPDAIVIQPQQCHFGEFSSILSQLIVASVSQAVCYTLSTVCRRTYVCLLYYDVPLLIFLYWHIYNTLPYTAVGIGALYIHTYMHYTIYIRTCTIHTYLHKYIIHTYVRTRTHIHTYILYIYIL